METHALETLWAARLCVLLIGLDERSWRTLALEEDTNIISYPPGTQLGIMMAYRCGPQRKRHGKPITLLLRRLRDHEKDTRSQCPSPGSAAHV